MNQILRHRRLQHAGDGAVRGAAAGPRGPRPGARPHHRAFAAVEARRPHGRPRGHAQHRPVLDAVRRHRRHGRGPRGRLPRRPGDAHQERAAPRRRPRHPPRRHRQRGRPVLHHRGDGQALPVLPREQHLPRLDAQGHEDRFRGAARRHGERLQAVGGAGLRPRRRRPALLPLRRARRLRPALHGRRAGRYRQGDGRGHRGRGRRLPGVQAGRERVHRDLVQRPLLGTRARSSPRTSASARRTTSTAPPRSPPTGARSTTSTRRRGRASSPRSPTSR